MKETLKINSINQYGAAGALDPQKSRLMARYTTAQLHTAALISIILVTLVGIGLPFTRRLTLLILDENNLVEMATFFVALIAGLGAIWLAFSVHRKGAGLLTTLFYFFFGVSLIVIGMEEIAWGQQILAFQTPSSIAAINGQGETTIHNIQGMNGNTEYLRLLYGLGGIIGVWIARTTMFRAISAPLYLLPWFLVITAHSTVDVANDIYPVQKQFDAVISELAELMELLIVVSAGIYLMGKLSMFNIGGAETDEE